MRTPMTPDRAEAFLDQLGLTTEVTHREPAVLVRGASLGFGGLHVFFWKGKAYCITAEKFHDEIVKYFSDLLTAAQYLAG